MLVKMLSKKKMNNDSNYNKKLSPEEKGKLRQQLARTTFDVPYQPRSGYLLHGLVKSTLSIALLVAFPGISILYAAEKALPNQGILYDLKRGGEEFMISFYTSPNDQVAFRETQIKRRVEEATQLVLRGSMNSAHADVLSRDIAAHVASAEATLQYAQNDKEEAVPKESVKQILAVQQKVLAAVAETQPEGSKDSITAIQETTAALENGLLTKKDFSESTAMGVKNEASITELEIEKLLVVARLEVKKAIPKTKELASSTEGVASASQKGKEKKILVTSATNTAPILTVTTASSTATNSRIILGETRELAGAEEALENLQNRFDILKTNEKETASDDSLGSLLTDIKVFLALLDSDVSLVTGFSFTQTVDPVTPNSPVAASSTNTQAILDLQKSVPATTTSTKETLLTPKEDSLVDSYSPEPIATDLN